MASVAWAQTISYTVQVAALSDQSAAESLRRTLQKAGYPAYLVSVFGDAQTVYRLRVGAFANREAAKAYADAMRGIGGTVPVPALAEGIPPELIPLEPKFVANYPSVPVTERLEVFPWGEGAALRTQGYFEDQLFAATYRVLTPAQVQVPFPAWRAAPLAADERIVERVTNLPLYGPDEANTLPQTGLSEIGRAKLAAVAEALGLTPEQIEPYIFSEPGRGAPFLIVAERYDPATQTGGRYPALGNPGTGRPAPEGPALVWFGRSAPDAFPEGLPEPLFSLSSLRQGGKVVPRGGRTFAGSGWQARSDGRFTVLRVGERSWRALVGQPLWAGGSFLLAYADQVVVLYEIAEPPR